MDYRNRPTVSIPVLPPGARPPVPPSPSAHTNYRFPDMGGPNDSSHLPNPWDDSPNSSTPTGSGYRYRTPSVHVLQSSRPPSRASTASATVPYSHPPSLAFPEPQPLRTSSSLAASSAGKPGHRASHSDLGPGGNSFRLHRDSSTLSVASIQSNHSTHSNIYYDDDSNSVSEDSHGHDDDSQLSTEFTELSLQSEEGIEKFQRGLLKDADSEWHRLVPKEALEALPKHEVVRQSVLFELVKSERDYVTDLATIIDVYVQPLATANPPIISPAGLTHFIDEVFGNVRFILANHQRMLAALFARQRETHPLIHSVADIILDTIVKEDFRAQYEEYVKHYPLAESHHRNEMLRNEDYRHFIQSSSSDPRVRKRDLATFLSRPVTRLPRLNLLLETILKETDKDNEHPDLETLPLITGILGRTVKSTQPGIEAAEGKVKFWELCESLTYRKGEIMDLDLYNPRRALEYMGPVTRKAKSDYSSSGAVLVLLDHCVLILKEEKRSNGVMKRQLISRPIPLAYLNLGSFTAPSELKRDPNEEPGSSSILMSKRTVPMFPFTIFHGFNPLERRYTLYVASEALRRKWQTHFQNALGLSTASQEANMYFDPTSLTDHFFRYPNQSTQAPGGGGDKTGRITCSTPFTSRDRRFLAVGTPVGIFVGPRGTDRFRRVLSYQSPANVIAVQGLSTKVFNKFIVLHENTLISYSLDLLARVALGEADSKMLHSSMERIAKEDGSVLFAKLAVVSQRMLLMYASRRFLSSSLNIHAVEVMDISDLSMRPNRIGSTAARSYRPLGDAGYVPKDAIDISALAKSIGVATQDGILIMNPTDFAGSQAGLVPDYRDLATNMPMAVLKQRIETDKAKPLGLVRCQDSELLIIYDRMGVYITRHGAPTRNSGFIKWEITATSFVPMNSKVLLLCPSFIEIRDIQSSKLLQVIEGRDIRLLWSPENLGLDEPLLVAMRGSKEEGGQGTSDKIVELVETHEISATTGRRRSEVPSESLPTPTGRNPSIRSPAAAPALWDEWDM